MVWIYTDLPFQHKEDLAVKNETVFQRYEFKYLLTRDQQARLLATAGEDCVPMYTATAPSETSIWTLQISGSSAGVWRNRSIRRNCACAAMAGRRETALFLWS